jgi:hypothetical protein
MSCRIDVPGESVATRRRGGADQANRSKLDNEYVAWNQTQIKARGRETAKRGGALIDGRVAGSEARYPAGSAA